MPLPAVRGRSQRQPRKLPKSLRWHPQRSLWPTPFFVALACSSGPEQEVIYRLLKRWIFSGAWDWDQKTASQKLAPCLRRTWFAEALLPRISYGAIDEKDAVTVLAEAAKAAPDKEKELRALIEFLVAGGVVYGEAGQVKLPKSVAAIDTAPQAQRTEEERPPESGSGIRTGRVNTAYAAQAPGGGVDFNINVHVDMTEFGEWRPERITAFFRGIAEVLSAKADVEKGGAGS